VGAGELEEIAMAKGTIVSAAAIAVSLVLVGCATEEPTPEESSAASATPIESGAATSTPAAPLAVPKTFPAAVPLLDGEIVVSNDLGTGWVVWIGSDDAANDFAAASELLTAAGFENTVTNSETDNYFASFTSEAYQVQLTAGDDPTYGVSIGYTVYPIS
jgi:hypothetical protein